jgi:5-(carboxyamino)imidazole ribonucleotide synthase
MTHQRVGIIGGGQLAWMMGEPAHKLGIDLVIQTPHPGDPAAAIASQLVVAPIHDAAATARLAAQCPVITFENEFIDIPGLTQLEGQGTLFRPPLSALTLVIDKYRQRHYYQSLGLPTPRAIPPDPAQIEHLSYPTVLKTRRFGYDGQGTFIVHSPQEYAAVLDRFRDRPHPLDQLLIQEDFIPFERELAVIAARSSSGAIAFYPLVETYQKNQVCRWVIAPAAVPPEVVEQARAIAHTLLTDLSAVGVFGIELFLTPDNQVWINEIAPRVHNSGHFTLDACFTSQFEQHLRAVSGLPLGDPAMHCAGAVMVNLLGYETSQDDYQTQRQQIAALPQSHVHWYGKTESRQGRKLGHVTTLQHNSDRAAALAIAQQVEALWYPTGANHE